MNIRSRTVNVIVGAMLTVATSLPLAHADEQASRISSLLASKYPDMPVDEVIPSPVQGLYEVRSGMQLFLVSSDASWVVTGDVIRLADEFNHSQTRIDQLQWKRASAIPESDMIVYEPTAETLGEVTVFTDTSCGYCRKLHEEREQLLSSGVRLKYVLYPRAGIDSETAALLESVWCADDANAALTAAKMDQPVSPAQCTNPLVPSIAAANEIGLQGTPMLFLSSGEVVRGYRPAAELIELLSSGTSGS